MSLAAGHAPLLSDIPPRLSALQRRLGELRQSGGLFLQHGDRGYASAPSNIALIKYWGKQPKRLQVPQNSSVSFTLGGFRSFSEVCVRGRFYPTDDITWQHARFANEISLQGAEFAAMPEKMDRFVRALFADWAPEISIRVSSENNFPTACGMASSASGYAALVGALADMLQLEQRFSASDLDYWLTEWARIGSGSATRSALRSDIPSLVAWELDEDCTKDIQNEKRDTTRTRAVEVSPALQHNLAHCVLVLSDYPKKVSSSQGHADAHSSPLQKVRVAGLPAKFEKMLSALKQGDFKTVCALSEDDAFALHAVMQSSQRPTDYLSGGTADAIAAFVQMRDAAGAPALWTLDAGPNIHFLFTREALPMMNAYLASSLERFGAGTRILCNGAPFGLLLGKTQWDKLRTQKLIQEGLPTPSLFSSQS